MRRLKNGAAISLLVLGTASVSGCAMFGARGGGNEIEPDPDLIARNLIHTLAQLPELHPMQTTLQISTPATPFGEHLLARLEDAGYGIQEVTADQGERYVRYRAERAETETGERTRYRIAVGEIALERDYRVVDGETLPGSTMSIRGAGSRDVALDDEMFAEEVPEVLSVARFDAEEEPVIVDLTVDSAASTLAASTVAASFAPTRESGEGFDAVIRKNLFETQRSNYAPLFAEYEDIRQDTLIFPNDSLVLGEANKAVIAEYVLGLDPATDVLSVIGCSHGRSAIDNGNELLAIGRSNRVKEAFMFAGVSHDQVLEESCWADHYHATFPRRGVVLTLKRRRDLS